MKSEQKHVQLLPILRWWQSQLPTPKNSSIHIESFGERTHTMNYYLNTWLLSLTLYFFRQKSSTHAYCAQILLFHSFQIQVFIQNHLLICPIFSCIFFAPYNLWYIFIDTQVSSIQSSWPYDLGTLVNPVVILFTQTTALNYFTISYLVICSDSTLHTLLNTHPSLLQSQFLIFIPHHSSTGIIMKNWL